MGWLSYTVMIVAMVYIAAIVLAVRDHFIPQPQYTPKPRKRKSRWLLIPLVLLSPVLVVGFIVTFLVLAPLFIWRWLTPRAHRYRPPGSN
jgi:protein-S-isoprenylcysteine O-methyltransferase Ste14